MFTEITPKGYGLMALAAATALLMLHPVHARANNSAVESTVRSFGDLSSFYQAMLNSGEINELREDQHYTIFAPTNVAFAQIAPRDYPCFYHAQCRPQIAALLRDHVIVGRYDLSDLVTAGQGMQTMGVDRLLIERPYTDTYTVNGRRILSKSETNGNIIYRVDGVIANSDQLSPFQNIVYDANAPAEPMPVTETVTTYTTDRPAPMPATQYRYPAGSMVPPYEDTGNRSQTTTIIHSYQSTPY